MDLQATLCFIVQNGKVLLIHKKRGIGAGKINGPGGKVDPGETPLAAAVREVREEIGVTPVDPQLIGDLRFRFTDGLNLHCLCYLAFEYTGDLIETAEALPEWFPIDALPYERMWDDDRYWMSWLLAGQRFHGWADVDGERVMDQRYELFPGDGELTSLGFDAS